MIKSLKELEKLLKKYMTNQQASFSKEDAKRLSEFPAANSLQYSENPEIYKCYEDFNEIYLTLKAGKFDFRPTILTPKGNIAAEYINYYRSWSCKTVKTTTGIFRGVKLMVIIDNKIYKCSFGHKGTHNSKVTGFDAYKAFTRLCKQYLIDLKSYSVNKEEGEAVKAKIPSPYIIANHNFKQKIYNHVYHLDIHSAWPAGVVKKFPEFKPVFEDLYSYEKTYGSKALGYCQSNRCGFKYSLLPYYGITWCNDKIRELVDKLQAQDFGVLMINTDGIWFFDTLEQGRVYHDEDEGTELGQWKMDHKDCDLFIMSAGYYYYIEDGKFNVVARGKYAYENIKPRDQWNAQDFIAAFFTQINITWDDDKGFVVYSNIYNQQEVNQCQEEFTTEKE